MHVFEFARRAGIALAALALFTVFLAPGPAPAQRMDDAGGIQASAVEIRATAPGMTATAGYLGITNLGDEPERLVAFHADFAARPEIHNMFEHDGILRMRRVDDGVDVPAGETVELRPGGLHLMFLGVERQLVPGDAFEVTLEFASGRRVIVPARVLPPRDITPGAGGPAHTGDGGGHDHHAGHDHDSGHGGHGDHSGHGGHGGFARFLGWIHGLFGGAEH